MGASRAFPLKVTAGPHTLGVTFVARTYAESDEVLHSFRPGAGEDRIPRVGSLEMVGPFTTAGVGDTPSRQRVSSCAARRAQAEELPCATTHPVDAGAHRAYRRPVTGQRPGGAARVLPRGRERVGDFDAGIREALPAILASPKFLYRAERAPAGAAPGSGPSHLAISSWRRGCRSS